MTTPRDRVVELLMAVVVARVVVLPLVVMARDWWRKR